MALLCVCAAALGAGCDKKASDWLKPWLGTGTSRQALRPPLDTTADLVLGQLAFSYGAANLTTGAGMATAPQAVALDTSEYPPRLYLADTANNRVLAWANALSFATGAPADRVIGQSSPLGYVCNQGNGVATAGSLCLPSGVAVDAAGNVYVTDSANHRVLRFNSPFVQDLSADVVLGQPSFSGRSCNNGNTTASASSLCTPNGVAVDPAGNVYIADSGNNRVLRFDAPLSAPVGDQADLVLGQVNFSIAVRNQVEARGLSRPMDVAIDRSASPNRIYVVDQDNHRVLGWADAEAYANGAPATLVIGQPDFSSPFANRGGSINNNTLSAPNNAVVDSMGNLYVGDSGNHRLLRFDSPFTTDTVADKVWGQPSFTATNGCWLSQTGLCSPAGMAISAAGDLYVADSGSSRVIKYTDATNGDAIADQVFGQPNFISGSCNQAGAVTATTMCRPKAVAFDASNNMYVADEDNSRVLLFFAPLDGIADRVFGQNGNFTTSANTVSATGMQYPYDVVIDPSGNLWVADQLNFRVVGFASPVADQTADVVLGKPNFTTVSCVPVSDTCTGTSAPQGLDHDSNGDLFVADTWNNRVLEYDAPLMPSSVAAVQADKELGQPNMSAVAANYLGPDGLASPVGIAVDASTSPAHLYVADTFNHRVLGWSSLPTINGQPADTVFGQASFLSNASSSGVSGLQLPKGVATAAGNLYVADTANHRVVEFNAPYGGGDTAADRVLGQATPASGVSPNQGLTQPTAATLYGPAGVAVDALQNVWAVDSENHRVLRYDAPWTTDRNADGVLGQVTPGHGGANLVDGVGLYRPNGVAIDRSQVPNRLYVVDTSNNRVLGWPDSEALVSGAPATLVIGQADLLGSAGGLSSVSASTLYSPAAAAVDGVGRLYVADAANNRVLIYDSPFTTDTVADRVIGQPSFNTRASGTTATSLWSPRGVALNESNDLWVSDYDNNRVMYYVSPYTTDAVADAVLGQPNFTSRLANRGASAPAANSMDNPAGLAYEALPTPRLYVADNRNHRALAFDAPISDGTADAVIGQTAFDTNVVGLAGPGGLYFPVDVALDLLGNLYVSSGLSARVVQYNAPRNTDLQGDIAYGQFDINSYGSNQPVAVGLPNAMNLGSPAGLAFDSQNNLYIVDNSNNRVLVYFSNTRPVATFPIVTPSSPYTTDALVGTYTYSDDDGDAENGTVVTWYRDGVAQGVVGLTVAANLTTRGESWYFKVQPKDGQAFGPWATSNTVVIQNSAPTAATLQISPTPARTADTLSASYAYSDADGDAESGSDLRWFRNGVEQAAYRGSTAVPASATTKGEVWYFSVAPSDGTAAGSPVASSPKTIANTAPTASLLSISPPSPLGGASLTATYLVADADSDAEGTSRIRWYRDSVLVAAYNDLKTVPAGVVLVGESWSYTLEPSDGTDFGPLYASPTAVVGSNAPVASALAIAPTPAFVTTALTRVYTYSDPDGDAESGTVTHWYKNGALQSAYDNQALIPTSQLVKIHTWYFTVQPRDALGTVGALQTSPTVVIANSPPSATGVTLAPPAPDTSAALQASWTYADANSDLESGTVVRWYRDGVELPALAGLSSAPASYTAKGQSWYFTVAPSDGTDTGAAVQSNVVTIVNAPPVANAGPDQSIVPTQATQPVSLDGQGSTDPDGDVLSYSWTEGATVLGTGSVATPNLAVGVHTIALTVSDGTSSSSDTVTISIADPRPTASISTGTSAPPGRVALIGSGLDPLGRSLTYQWTQVSGAPVTITGATQPTASYFATAAGPRQFELVVTAGTQTSTPASVTVTTLNVAPFAAVLPRKVGQRDVAVQLDATGSSDPNGDVLNYQWSLDGAGATTATFDDPASPTPTLTAALDGRYLVRLVVSDGFQDSIASLGEVLVIDSNLTQHAPVANAGSDAFADVGRVITLDGRLSYDIDGDPLTYTWRQVSGPSGELLKGTTAQPTFRPSATGAVVLGLTVGDGQVQSPEDMVSLYATDPAVDGRPIARAQGDASAVVAGTAQLDGTRSIDPDGDALTYHWTQVEGVQVTLSNDASDSPTFVPLQPGQVRFELEVSDGTLTSARSSVTVLVTKAPNQPPTANAGPDQTVQVGTGTVTLDGSLSSDPESAPLSYVWEQLLGPPVALSGTPTAPAFTPPGLARYRFRLVVRDAEAPSLPDEVDVAVATHGANNQQPIANAGADQAVAVGTLVQLDGSASSDADPLDNLSYEWSFVAFPTGNEPTLNSASISLPTFTPAAPGPYTLRLVVSDGDLASAPTFVTVTAGGGVAAQGCGCDQAGWAPLAMLGALAECSGRRRRRSAPWSAKARAP